MKLDNINSLNKNPGWENTSSIFHKYEAPINLLSKDFSKKYNFAEKDIRNAFIYELMSFQYSSKKLNSFLSEKYLNYFFLYYSLMLFFVLISPVLIFINFFRKKQTFDILYEEMWDKNSWYKRFYKYIDDELNGKLNRAILFTTMSLKKIYDNNRIDLWTGAVVDVRNKNRFLDPFTVIKVLSRDFFYGFFLYKLSRKNKVNFTLLYILALKRVLMYSSQISDVKAKILIAAGDYYWNPLKYLCYKKNIANIILLQHNNKDTLLYGRLFPYCDYYFGHSKTSLSKLVGLEFTQKFPVGSLQLVPFLTTKENIFDILFINQTVKDNLTSTPQLDQADLILQHNILISNFKKYLKENKKINALYICKPGYKDKEPAKSVKEDFKDIKNIHFMEAYGPETFSMVSKSKIIINMYSSVGREAYGLDKKVLWINYNNCCKEFELELGLDDLHVMIDNSTYQAFEQRVNLLLSEDEKVHAHYKSLKEKYMNIQENPAKIIANKIYEILELPHQ